MTGQFEFRDAYGRWTSVTPCWVTNPSGEGGRPVVQFRLACGACLQVPREIVPDVVAAVREAAAEAGPDSPAAVGELASGGFVEVVGGACASCPGVSPTVPDPGCREGVGDTGRDMSATSCRGMSPLVATVEAGPDCGTIVVHPVPSATLRDDAGTWRGHPGDALPAQCEACGTGTHLMAGGAYATCARLAHEAAMAAEGAERPGEARPGWMQGRCPACGRRSLIATWDGFLSCSTLECPDPGAAARILSGKPDGWVRASEALRMVAEVDERLEGMTNRALAARRYAETLPAPVGDKVVALLTGRAPLDAEAAEGAGAAVAAAAAGPGEKR